MCAKTQSFTTDTPALETTVCSEDKNDVPHLHSNGIDTHIQSVPFFETEEEYSELSITFFTFFIKRHLTKVCEDITPEASIGKRITYQ